MNLMKPMRRTVWGMLAVMLLLAATACTVTTEDPAYVPPAPLPPMEQLEKAVLADPQTFSNGGDVLSFVTEDRSVACSLTSARGEHVDLPYEQNSFADSANNKLATIPVAHCELATYPDPADEDVKDDCAGTGLGYLGGAALLTPDSVRYGECRSGVTQMEATYGPGGARTDRWRNCLSCRREETLSATGCAVPHTMAGWHAETCPQASASSSRPSVTN